MSRIAGQVVRVVLTAAIGLTLGFFVAVSVFADGTRDERRVAIGVPLLIYGIAGAALGFDASSWYGLGLALPGVSALVWFAGLGEGHGWYLLYGALIVTLAVGGTYAGASGWARFRPRERTVA